MKHFRHCGVIFPFLLFHALALQSSSADDAGTLRFSALSFFQQNRSWLGSDTATLSDFDGDNRPDVAIGRFDGHSFNLEIQLNIEHQRISFELNRTRFGIHLLACDVDRDNDQDLILVSDTSILPLAIWLNDGKAHFEEGSRCLWLNLIDNDNPSSLHPKNPLVSAVSITPPYRLPMDRSVTGFLAEKLFPRARAVQESRALRLSFHLYHLGQRGPPRYC